MQVQWVNFGCKFPVPSFVSQRTQNPKPLQDLKGDLWEAYSVVRKSLLDYCKIVGKVLRCSLLSYVTTWKKGRKNSSEPSATETQISTQLYSSYSEIFKGTNGWKGESCYRFLSHCRLDWSGHSPHQDPTWLIDCCLFVCVWVKKNYLSLMVWF